MLDKLSSLLSFITSNYGKVKVILNRDTTSIYDLPDEKEFIQIDPKKNNEITGVYNDDPAFIQTKYDKEFLDLQQKVGRFAYVIDFIFSPNFAKILTLVGACAMFFSPVGPIVGAVGGTVALGSLAYGIYAEARRYQYLCDIKKERAILEEIKSTKAELNTLLEQNPQLKELLKGVLFDKNKILDRHERDMKGIAFKTALATSPSAAWAIGSALVTGNPIAIVTTIVSRILGYSADVSNTGTYKLKLHQLINYNQRMKEDLGLTDFKPSQSIEANKYILSALRVQVNAVKIFSEIPIVKENLTKPISPENADKLKNVFVKIYNAEPQVEINIKPTTFKEAFISSFKNEFSARNHPNQFVVFRNDYFSETSNSTYTAARTEILINQPQAALNFPELETMVNAKVNENNTQELSNFAAKVQEPGSIYATDKPASNYQDQISTEVIANNITKGM